MLKILKRVLCLLVAAVLLLPVLIACSTAQADRERKIKAMRDTVVLKVNDMEVSALEFSYNYYSTVAQFTQTYSSYLNYIGLDPSVSLRDQVYDKETGQTWAEYFIEATTEQLKQVLFFYGEAVSRGAVLSEGSKNSIDAYVLEAREAAEKADKTLDGLLEEYYGIGMTEADYRTFLERRFLASDYLDEYLASREYSDVDYETYYLQNKDDLDAVDLRFFFLPVESLDEDASEEEIKAAAEACKASANAFLSEVTDEASFAAAALKYAAEKDKEIYQEDTATYHKGQYRDDISEDYTDWLFDEVRKEGDKVMFSLEEGCAIFYFIRRYRPEHSLASMRHILLKVTETKAEDGTVTTDDAEVKAKAEALLKTWKEGDATEDSFSALVADNTADTSSASTGGLYENFDQGEMVAGIENWIWAEGRKPGDCEVVSSTYGYHLVYFLEYTQPRWKQLTFDALQEEDYNALLETLEKSYSVDVYEEAYDLIDTEE